MKSLELYCSFVDGEIVRVLEECTCKTKRPVWNTQGLIKTAQNCPHWNNSSVLWRKRLSASNITTLSYSTKLHAYSLFNDNLNLLSKLSWCLYGFSRFSTLTTFAPSSFSLDNTQITNNPQLPVKLNDKCRLKLLVHKRRGHLVLQININLSFECADMFSRNCFLTSLVNYGMIVGTTTHHRLKP